MILVTGASGFLGQHLVRRLSASGETVRALYRHTPPDAALSALPGVTWQQCDLLDVFETERSVAGVEDIYHCAAIVSFDPARKAQVLQQNVESTANLVNAALEANVRKVAYVSSVASLGRSEQQTSLISEDAEWEESSRNSAYGTSKYYAELEVWRGIGEGLDAVILNPGIILGAGNWDKGSARLMQVVHDEFPYYTDGVNAFVDVADVVDILLMAMAAPLSAERFIVSAGNFPYRDIFTQMAHALGKKPPHIRASSLMTGFVWRWSLLKSRLSGSEPTITRETVRNAQSKCFYDNTKLLKAFPGFQYRPIAETIAGMSAAFLKK